MKPTDFSHPQRMSRGAFPIIMWNSVKRFSAIFLTIIVVNLFKPDPDSDLTPMEAILLSCALCLVLAGIAAAISYLFKKFHVSEGKLVVSNGLFDRENISIPLDKIHSLRTQEGLLYRLFDLRGIVFDTLATRHEELELILSDSDWKGLLSLIDTEERRYSDASADAPDSKRAATTVVFPTTKLLLAALCQNHLKGMAVLGSIFAVVFSNLSDFPKDTADKMADWVENYFSGLTYSIGGMVMFFLAGYLMILLFWLGRVLFRYGDMTMTFDRRLITFTHGLITRESSRFFHDRICTLWIKRNFLERKFGFSTIMLCQALNASAQKEDDRIRIYGNDDSEFFLNWWLGEGKSTESDLLSAKSGRGVMILSIIPSALLTSLAVFLLWHFNLLIWLPLPILYLAGTAIKGIFKMRHSRIHLKPEFILIEGGSFAHISNYLKYENVEVVRIHRSPLSRSTHRVALSLSTSGTTFRLRSLPEAEALAIYEAILAKANGNIESIH